MNELQIKPLQIDGNVWRWQLLSSYEFSVNGRTHTIPPGFTWDGASKPLSKRAFLCLSASHWALVMPSMVHDFICDNRGYFAKAGVSSVMAAELFNVQCKLGMSTWEAYKLWKAVSLFGPKWKADD